ncbi:MAG: ABC transporter ATP-binding protein [archaeon GB-1867-035]|nr:ABC transporter ATP-binding protein [Candidatus Culexmicrobium profundum]
MSAIIETENLTKIYHVDGREIRAVDGLNLTVYEGELFGYLGPNGSGKTTTILMLLGLISPTSGGGRVAGFDIIRESKAVRSVTGFIPEKFSFYEDLPAYDNLAYFAKLNGIVKNEIDDRIKWALNIVELSDWINAPVKTFSRGMRQRLALANILIKKPKIIFLDEPTAGLDPYATANFRSLIKRLNEEFNITIFLSSHMLHEVRQICNRIGFLNKGRLVAVDTIEGFMEKMGIKIILEATNLSDKLIKLIEALDDVNRVFKSNGELIIYAREDVRLDISKIVTSLGEHVLTLKIEPPTLEEVFFLVYGGEGR